MAAKPIPSQDILRQLLDYDPETGMLYWKASPLIRPNNKRLPGTLALATKTPKGYFRGRLCGRSIMAHRVVWKWHHGTEPIEIDHDDGDPGNNLIGNLISSDRQGNTRNTSLRKNNTSGVQGVYHRRGYWIASIRADGRRIDLGYFRTIEDAAACRKQGEVEHGYHPNHGRVKV